MLTYSDIDQALAMYDQNKSLWRKLVVDKVEIAALRRFARDDNKELTSSDLFEVINIIVAISKYAKHKGSEDKLADNLQSKPEVKRLVSATKELLELDMLTIDNFEAILTVKTKFNGYFGKYSSTVAALNCLNEAGILTLENRNAVNQCHGYPVFLAKIFVLLDKAGILTSENRKTLVNLPDLTDVHAALDWMYVPDPSLPQHFLFITQDNINAIFNHQKPNHLAIHLRELATKGILNQQTRDAVKNHSSASSMSQALQCLHDPCGHYIVSKNNYTNTLFTPENIDAVAKHENALDVVYALGSLYEQNILTAENREAVKNHPLPRSLADALVNLDNLYNSTWENTFKNSSFYADNIELIKAHPNPEQFYLALYYLHKSNILTPENREIVKNHPRAEMAAKALEMLRERCCLNQKFFNRVIIAANPVESAKELLSDLPRLKNQTSHPYTKGAAQGLFSSIDPKFRDISSIIAKHLSRSSGGSIARTCKAAAVAAKHEEEKALKIKYR